MRFTKAAPDGVMRYLALVVLLAAALSALKCSERQESFYTSLADAEHDGAVARGWVPEILPRSATGIRECHDLDSNETWGMFQFGHADAEKLRGGLSDVDLREKRVNEMPGRGCGGWWLQDLGGRIDAETLRQAGYRAFLYAPANPEDRRSLVVLLVNFGKRSAYFWSPSS